MKKIIAFLSTFLTVSAIIPFSATGADTQSTARLYFAADKTSISLDEAKTGVKIPVSLYLEDESFDIQSLSAKWICKSEYVTLKGILNPLAETEVNEYVTSQGESFKADFTPFCFSSIVQGKLKPNGTINVDESELGDNGYTDNIVNNRLALTYMQNLMDSNGNEIKKSSYLGAKSDEYILTSFTAEFSPETPIGYYSIEFVEDENTANSSYCNFYSGDGETVLSKLTFSVGFTRGDVNNDNEINALDASQTLSEYAKTSVGNSASFSQTQSLAADVNMDSKINASDASAILAYYADKSTGNKASFDK